MLRIVFPSGWDDYRIPSIYVEILIPDVSSCTTGSANEPVTADVPPHPELNNQLSRDPNNSYQMQGISVQPLAMRHVPASPLSHHNYRSFEPSPLPNVSRHHQELIYRAPSTRSSLWPFHSSGRLVRFGANTDEENSFSRPSVESARTTGTDDGEELFEYTRASERFGTSEWRLPSLSEIGPRRRRRNYRFNRRSN